MWRLRDTVHAALTDEGGALLDERSGRWTALTPTAAAAVTSLLAAAGVEQAADRYADRYGIDRAQALHDLVCVADTLTTAGLVDDDRPATPRRRGWRWSR